MIILADKLTYIVRQRFTGSPAMLQSGQAIIRESGLNVIAADDLRDGAEKIVKAVNG